MVNSMRSNYPMTEIKEKTDHGSWLCQLYSVRDEDGDSKLMVHHGTPSGHIYLQNGQVEPQVGVRGRVARAYLYMASTYPERIALSPEEWMMYHRWNEEEPPGRAEKLQNTRIQQMQGNPNPYISQYGQQMTTNTLPESWEDLMNVEDRGGDHLFQRRVVSPLRSFYSLISF